MHHYGACLRNRAPPAPPAEWNNMYGEAKLKLLARCLLPRKGRDVSI